MSTVLRLLGKRGLGAKATLVISVVLDSTAKAVAGINDPSPAH
jgi:hypothetical protein